VAEPWFFFGKSDQAGIAEDPFAWENGAINPTKRYSAKVRERPVVYAQKNPPKVSGRICKRRVRTAVQVSVVEADGWTPGWLVDIIFYYAPPKLSSLHTDSQQAWPPLALQEAQDRSLQGLEAFSGNPDDRLLMWYAERRFPELAPTAMRHRHSGPGDDSVPIIIGSVPRGVVRDTE
jgi:hypothetical protein